MEHLVELASPTLLNYPDAFLKGIPELTSGVFATLFPDWQCEVSPPQAINDCRMSHEVVSLIALESAWCRGFMVMQADSGPLLGMLGKSHSAAPEMDGRAANSLLGEITNLVWGAFKNCYIGPDSEYRGSPVQVPLVIDRTNDTLHFGTENPQLRFLYTLSNANGHLLKMDQRFIFHLYWAPEDYCEFSGDPAKLESGELEFF